MIQMGVMKTSKDQYLLVIDSSKAQEKWKSKKRRQKQLIRNLNKINKLSKDPPALSRKRSYVPIVKRGTILNIIV